MPLEILLNPECRETVRRLRERGAIDAYPDGLGLFLDAIERQTLSPLRTCEFALEDSCIRQTSRRLFVRHGASPAAPYTTFRALEPAVRLLLQQRHGHLPPPLDVSPLPLPARDPPLPDTAVLEAIATRRETLVRYGQSIDPARLLTQVAIAFPASRIVITESRRQRVRELAKALRRAGIECHVITDRRPHPPLHWRIGLGTPAALAMPASALGGDDILVAMSARELTSDVGRLLHREARPARPVGLLPGRKRLSPRDWDYVRCLFGFFEVDLLRHGEVVRSVRTAFLRVTGGPRIARDGDVVQLKRTAIWKHPVRNRRIARLAKGLVTGDATICASLPSLRSTEGERATVAILVENQEHAELLRAHCPGWRIWTNESCGLTVPDSLIYALPHVDQIPTDTLDVLIRADGGTGDLPLSGGALSGTARRPLLLVDFQDRHHPQLRRWSRQRRQAYRQRGWFEPGADPELERARDWLEDRPT